MAMSDSSDPRTLLDHAPTPAKDFLKELDDVKFGWFHLRAILVSGIGFFTDAYDLFIINLVVPMLGYVYFIDQNNTVPSQLDGVIKGSAAVGTLIGQLVFGYLADVLGRKKMYGVELMIMIVGCLGCALSSFTYSGISIVGMLSFWRLILGIGIGGDYPLSAVITSEFASKKNRGLMVAAVFAMQGVGILAAALITVTVLAAYKNSINDNPQMAIDQVWRICLGLGAVPALCALYFRLTIPETPRFTLDVHKNDKKAFQDATNVLRLNQKAIVTDLETNIQIDEAPVPKATHHSTLKAFREYFSNWKRLKILLGTSIAWFALDVAFYGINLNQSIVLSAIGYAPKNASPFDTLFQLAVGNLIIALMGNVPGYWISVGLIDKWGRLPIQMMGFTVLTVLFLILAIFYHSLINIIPLFLFLFTLAQLFFNFGPNMTTFVIPGEVFETRVRSTAHGISAASGKFGAILATYAFGPLKDIGGKNAFMPWILGIFSCFMLLGLLVTFWIPETMGKSLEELGNDSRRPSIVADVVEDRKSEEISLVEQKN